MRHTSRHPRLILTALAIAAGATISGCASASAGSGSANSAADSSPPGAQHGGRRAQRIAIEERWRVDSPTGTFRLIPLTPGPLKSDEGTFIFPESTGQAMIRGGQSVTVYKGVDTLTGAHGTLIVPNVSSSTDAGGSFQAGVSTWSIAKATGVYASLRGGGRGSIVATPEGLVLTRYEGYVGAG
jgi:hypothetical protein